MQNITVTAQDALLNRQAWDSIRRQRDNGLIAKHNNVAAEILAGNGESEQLEASHCPLTHNTGGNDV